VSDDGGQTWRTLWTSAQEVKSVLLTSTISCRSADSQTIGYKTPGADSINIRNIPGFPLDKTILGYSVEHAYLHQHSANVLCFINIYSDIIYANSVVGGDVDFGIRVFYKD
jgi:hypothetical protein